jgi:lipid A disaccharide synthetase
VSLVNIIARRGVVKELLAHFFTAENTSAELEKLLFTTTYRTEILSGYAEISQTLGTSIAAERAAEEIVG